MTRLCTKCGRSYPDPILFCEEDGTQLVAPAPAQPFWKMAAAGFALALVLATAGWFGLREYMASFVTLDLVDLRPPAVRSDGTGFIADSGSVALKLSLHNGSRLPFTLRDAWFDIEMGETAMKSQLRPKEPLPATIAAGARFAISLESENMGQRQLSSSTYNLAVKGRYRAELWGLPLEFPGSALAKVRIDKKK